MKILFIAPIPPPISGHSLAGEVLLRHLEESHEVKVVNLSRVKREGRIGKIQDFFTILGKIWQVRMKHKGVDRLYLTISESVSGNIKDLLIYLICYKNLSQMTIHLHGGSFRKLLLDRYPILFKLNQFFIKKLKKVIILGESHRHAFNDLIAPERVVVIPNFATDDVFLSLKDIELKFEHTGPLRILFLSNLLPMKGFQVLLDAYTSLNVDEKQNMQLDFAGRFDSGNLQEKFLQAIKQEPNITYHGVVKGPAKVALLAQSHLFCLPTSYAEGQPISILEAYAAGCIVATTNQGGICDVFQDELNGFLIKDASAECVREVLRAVYKNRDELLKTARFNRQEAWEKYRLDAYNHLVGEAILV
jgi:glycosyltransferase involved in cell wall biosynthesis